MTKTQFNSIVKTQLKMCENLLVTKSKEYCLKGEDRLANFKTAAYLLGGTPKQAIAGYMAKHVVSIFDMIDKDFPVERWEEKITDLINYLLLLKAQVIDETH